MVPRALGMAVRLAVIGCGAWGINHVRAATHLRGAELAVVCDPSRAARERAHQVAPLARTAESPDEVFRAPDVDAVIIAAPAAAHARLALAALRADKHVLVEKPFVLDHREGPPIVDEAERRGRTLMVGHILRYHPYFRALEALVRSGELGRVHYVYGERVNLGAVCADENAFWALAPHDVSMMGTLVRAAPVEVTATGQAFLRDGVEDVVFATIRFADDTLGHIHVSWLDPHKRRRLTVVGSKKMAVFDDMEPLEKLRIHDKGVDAGALGGLGFDASLTVREGDIHAPSVRMVEPLHAEQQHFVDCIREQRVPETDGHEALRVSRVLVAAQDSLRAGGRPVRL